MEPRRETGAEGTRLRELRALFDQVAELPETQRRAALERACAADPARIEEVLALVRAAEHGDGFLVPPPRAQPAIVGRFVLERILERGGSGTLHQARATGDPAPVALRIVPLGEHASEEVARLRGLARRLASLAHPSLARSIETGLCVSPDGSGRGAIYFASELVPGAVPLADFAREARAPRECLELFLDACDAMAHAHARGVGHGDLSTTGVQVDERRRARVVDLGVRAVFPVPRAPDDASDRIALAELLRNVLERLPAGDAPWRERALALVERASRPDVSPELATLAGFSGALRRETAR